MAFVFTVTKFHLKNLPLIDQRKKSEIVLEMCCRKRDGDREDVIIFILYCNYILPLASLIKVINCQSLLFKSRN